MIQAGSANAWSVVLRRVRLLDPWHDLDQDGDLWIEAGRIRALGRLESLPDGVETIDGQGWVVGPGLVDLHAHSGEPGFEGRETQGSLAAAALAGGFTQVGILPTTQPPLDSSELLPRWLGEGPPRWLPLAALTQRSQGEQLSELAELAQAGAAGFCDDGPLSLLLLSRIIEYAQPLDKPLLIWPWDASLAQAGLAWEGEWALRLGLKGIPIAAETAAVAAILEVLRRIPLPVHLIRISQSRSLDLIAVAQRDGIPVSASTTWMHLVHAEPDMASYDTGLRLDPPLGSLANRDRLIDGLSNGTLCAIATDHHPYTFEEKAVPFGEALPGAIGLELALPLLWAELVETGRIPALTLWQALSLNPARCLRIPLPTLGLGELANLTIFDPTQEWTVNAETIRSRSQATYWWGRRMRGRVRGCITAGLQISDAFLGQ